MSKAEEEANKRYRVTRGDDTEETSGIDMQRASDFIDGYHQAEKDNELAWEDVNTIIGLYNDLDDNTLCNPERACKEILKQFKERKEK